MPAPPRAFCCSFCGADVGEVDLLIRSHIGGMPAMICDGCIAMCAEIAAAHQRGPDFAAALVAAINDMARADRR